MVLELARLGALDRPVTRVVHTGANSLASSSPPTSNSSIASTPTWSRSTSSRRASSSALAWSASSRPGAGARVTRRMPSSCTFSTTGQHAIVAVDVADGEHRQLAIERHEGFEDQRGTPEIRPRASASSSFAEHVLALPVVPALSGLEHRRAGRSPPTRARAPCASRPGRTPRWRSRPHGTSPSRRGGPAPPRVTVRRAAPGRGRRGSARHRPAHLPIRRSRRRRRAPSRPAPPRRRAAPVTRWPTARAARRPRGRGSGTAGRAGFPRARASGRVGRLRARRRSPPDLSSRGPSG